MKASIVALFRAPRARDLFENLNANEVEFEAFHVRNSRQEFLTDLKHSYLDTIKPMVNVMLRSHDVILDKSTAAYKQLCRAASKVVAEGQTNAEILVKKDRENLRLNFAISDSEPEKELELTFQSVILKSFKDNERNSRKKKRESVSKAHLFAGLCL